jgi:IclR family acetate operon transcriptional repressor
MLKDIEQKVDRYNIRAVERALRLLSLMSDGKPHTLRELSNEVGINSSTTFRILATLSCSNYVERDAVTGAYRVGIACLGLAGAYIGSSDIRRIALAELERLRDETKETVHLAVLDKMEVVYIEKLHGLHAIGIMHSQVGGRAPAYCTGLGKLLLAYSDPALVRSYYTQTGLSRFSDATIGTVDSLLDHLEKIRGQGYALDLGEHEAEVRCVAAPIFGMSGRVLAAISVSGPASRMQTLETQTALIQKTRAAASRISSRIGYRARS